MDRLADYQRKLDSMIAGGMPFAEVEDFIESAGLNADQKSALWLLAWSEQDRHTQRAIAEEALASLS